MVWPVIRLLAVSVVILLAPIGAIAQTSSPPAAPAAPTTPLLKAAELDQLVAPIALYPDPLLAEVLMASAYPLDVVEAERWLQSNKDLKGDALKEAAAKQDWDDSIKALVATPEVLDMMSQQLDWTQKLGDAIVAQQADVMDAIQRLRAKAQANNKLPSTKEQTVTVSTANNRQIISIEPTDPSTLYVPYYDPGVVYGDWPYSDYPPYYWPAPGYIGAGIIAAGIGFGAGYLVGRWASGGNYWGGGVNWNNNNINIDRPIGGGGNNWRPRVDHHQAARGGRGQGGLDFRGSSGRPVINPGGGRGNAGQGRPGNRPSAGAGNRPHAGTRPSGGGGRHRAGTRPSRGGGSGARVSHRGGGGGARVSHRGRPGGGGAVRARGGGGGGARARAGGGGRGGGGGARGGGGRGGGGGGGRGGGGRRSDIRLKHDIVLLGRLDDGLGFYRFSYNGSHKAYVGVMAQEVERVMPQAVARDRDGYLTVNYDVLGLRFESYQRWLGSGGQIPHVAHVQH
jgi:hypothetical protein